MHRALITFTLAVLAALAIAGGASAATFCVLPANSCPGPQTYTTLTAALLAATNNGAGDTIDLGAATYTAPTTAGFVYNDQTEAIDIAGQGAGTVLTGPTGALRVLFLVAAGPGSAVHDLSVHLPASAAATAEGIESTTVDLSRVAVDADPAQASSMTGVALTGGADLDHSTVTVDDSGNVLAVGVRTQDVNSTISDSTVDGYVGVESSAGGTVDRVRITSRATGVEADNVPALVRDCQVRMLPSQQSQTAIAGYNIQMATIANCTLIGNGGAGSVGVGAHAFSGNDTSVDVANVVIHGFANALQRFASNGFQSTLAIRDSDYDPSNLIVAGPGAINPGAGNGFHAAPGFADEANGDYSLVAGSPLIDRGDPLAAVGATDLLGQPRAVDGDGNGSAVPDIGAFESPSVGGGGGGGGGGGAGGSAPGGAPAVMPAGPSPAGPSSPAPAGRPAADRHAPVISRLRVSARLLWLTVDEAALIGVRIEHRTGTGLHLVRRLRIKAGSAGALRIALGRLHGKRYRVVVSATDAAGNRSAAIARKLTR